jgi:hypothetical protein
MKVTFKAITGNLIHLINMVFISKIDMIIVYNLVVLVLMLLVVNFVCRFTYIKYINRFSFAYLCLFYMHNLAVVCTVHAVYNT